MMFFFLLYNQISILSKNMMIKNSFALKTFGKKNNINFIFKVLVKFFFWVFFLSLMYTTTFLPAGRYYQVVWGNIGMLIAYLYVIYFLSFRKLRDPVELSNLVTKFFLK